MIRAYAPDDVPVVNRSRAPHGSADNPHVVRSPSALFCEECRVSFAGVLLERLRVALAAKPEASGG